FTSTTTQYKLSYTKGSRVDLKAKNMMASPHVLLVEDSCVDRLVASRVLKCFNIRGEITNMNFHLHSTISLLDILFCKYLVLNFIPIPKWRIMVCTTDFP